VSEHTPIILIELLLVLGGTLGFGWWQLRSIRRDREKAAAERTAGAESDSRSDTGDPPEREPS
jgi:hypothetical protein